MVEKKEGEKMKRILPLFTDLFKWKNINLVKLDNPMDWSVCRVKSLKYSRGTEGQISSFKRNTGYADERTKER